MNKDTCYVNNHSCYILNNINEGIFLLNQDFQITLWNNIMERITGIARKDALHKSVYQILPSLDKKYFRELLKNVIQNGCEMFFSAAMHSNLITAQGHYNLKISKVQKDLSPLILCELIDVTDQFIRVKQLKEHINQLYILNKQLREKEKIIRQLAYYDSLTKVANRTFFYKIANKFLKQAQKCDYSLDLIFIDVDKFKKVNDTYGHETGDKVLIYVAGLLKKIVAKKGIVARIGGDEFLIMLPKIRSNQKTGEISSSISNSEKKLRINPEQEINISLSLGISSYPQDGTELDDLVAKADAAMYVQKRTK